MNSPILTKKKRKKTHRILSLQSWVWTVGWACLGLPCSLLGLWTDTRSLRGGLSAFPWSCYPSLELVWVSGHCPRPTGPCSSPSSQWHSGWCRHLRRSLVESRSGRQSPCPSRQRWVDRMGMAHLKSKNQSLSSGGIHKWRHTPYFNLQGKIQQS